MDTAYLNRKKIFIRDTQSAFNNLSRSKTLMAVNTNVSDAYQIYRNLYCSPIQPSTVVRPSTSTKGSSKAAAFRAVFIILA